MAGERLALPAPVIVHVVDAAFALASVQFVAVQFENASVTAKFRKH